jgi:hypothetical protein
MLNKEVLLWMIQKLALLEVLKWHLCEWRLCDAASAVGRPNNLILGLFPYVAACVCVARIVIAHECCCVVRYCVKAGLCLFTWRYLHWKLWARNVWSPLYITLRLNAHFFNTLQGFHVLVRRICSITVAYFGVQPVEWGWLKLLPS